MAGEETAAQRFNRDLAQIQDTRRVRGLDNQTAERASRLYVNKEDGTTPADNNLVNPNP